MVCNAAARGAKLSPVRLLSGLLLGVLGQVLGREAPERLLDQVTQEDSPCLNESVSRLYGSFPRDGGGWEVSLAA